MLTKKTTLRKVIMSLTLVLGIVLLLACNSNSTNSKELSPEEQQKLDKVKGEDSAEGTEDRKSSKELTSLTITANGVSFEMIRVEVGTFTMGATSEQENPKDDEYPTHSVTLTKNYYLGKTEVTQALWEAVMGGNPSHYKGDNRPVEKVSWNDCQTFIKKLNVATGKNFRLPTEAEWEFAARGGNKSENYQYSGSNNLSEVAWWGDNSGDQTHEVATKQPNELDLYDMSGNVWEWCQDWYGDYSSSAQTNPTGPNTGSYRVRRGGSFFDDVGSFRSSRRWYYDPSGRGNSCIGLRLALEDM